MFLIQLTDSDKPVYLEVLRDGVCYGVHKENSAMAFRKRHLADLFLAENSALLSRGAKVVEVQVPERAIQQPKNLETREN